MVSAIFKGMLAGGLFTWLTTLFVGSSGSTGAQLMVFKAHVEGHSFYWSWPLFAGLTLLFGAIAYMMDS